MPSKRFNLTDPAAPRGIRRRLVFRLLAVFGASVVVAALCELLVAVGLVDFRLAFSTYGAKEWENPRNRADPELMHLHRPHDRFRGSVPGDLVGWLGIRTDRRYEVDVQYDTNGFRNSRDFPRADVVMI